MTTIFSYAQVNIKIAYNGQYNTFNETNKLFSSYNSNTNEILQKYKNFHFSNGLEIGARYMITDGLGIEASVASNFTGDNKTSKTVNASQVSDEWRINNRVYAIGLESYFGSFGIGAQLGYSNWKYLKDFVGLNSKQAVFNDSNYNLKLSFILQAKSDKNAFALKPFYNYPISNLDIAKVNQSLNGSSNSIQENFQSFGLSIVFYNGAQTNN